MPRSLAVVCGVDEAGRGPLAGPVYAAAVVLDPAHPIRGLKDSKKLLPEVREELREKIFARAKAWYIAYATVAEIDTLNILGASLLAMQRAVAGLGFQPEETLIDGNRLPDIPGNVRCIVRGDAKNKSISAASILAKTARDAEMCRLAQQFPLYGFDQHKGYATPEHLGALGKYGACEIHRRSFEPVWRAMQMELW
jgi:ribonuclease HII